MIKYTRSESLVMLNGTWEGTIAAAVEFGPHATGLSNVLWMPCKGHPAAG